MPADDDKVIYLDYAATTPVDPRVVELMLTCLGPDGLYANPASAHVPGEAARERVEEARAEVAALIGAEPREIVFTSGATEAINLALLGLARYYHDRPRHVVTSRIEHKAGLDACAQLEREGCRVTYLAPDGNGAIGAGQIEQALRDDTLVVSIMHVNNEIGVVQDIDGIGRLCRERGVKFHVDAAQSAGKLPIDVESAGIDLLSLSAHKLYGPKGIGALYVRQNPRCNLEPLLHGGGHERGLRSGTLATHQIVGIGRACALARAEMRDEAARIVELRDRLWAGLADLGGVLLNGDPHRRVAGILNVSVEGVEGESLHLALRSLAVSRGAACSSANAEASYVLRSLGRDDQLAQASIRFSLGRFTTAEEIDRAIVLAGAAVRRLRGLAPRPAAAPAGRAAAARAPATERKSV